MTPYQEMYRRHRHQQPQTQQYCAYLEKYRRHKLIHLLPNADDTRTKEVALFNLLARTEVCCTQTTGTALMNDPVIALATANLLLKQPGQQASQSSHPQHCGLNHVHGEILDPLAWGGVISFSNSKTWREGTKFSAPI